MSTVPSTGNRFERFKNDYCTLGTCCTVIDITSCFRNSAKGAAILRHAGFAMKGCAITGTLLHAVNFGMVLGGGIGCLVALVLICQTIQKIRAAEGREEFWFQIFSLILLIGYLGVSLMLVLIPVDPTHAFALGIIGFSVFGGMMFLPMVLTSGYKLRQIHKFMNMTPEKRAGLSTGQQKFCTDIKDNPEKYEARVSLVPREELTYSKRLRAKHALLLIICLISIPALILGAVFPNAAIPVVLFAIAAILWLFYDNQSLAELWQDRFGEKITN